MAQSNSSNRTNWRGLDAVWCTQQQTTFHLIAADIVRLQLNECAPLIIVSVLFDIHHSFTLLLCFCLWAELTWRPLSFQAFRAEYCQWRSDIGLKWNYSGDWQPWIFCGNYSSEAKWQRNSRSDIHQPVFGTFKVPGSMLARPGHGFRAHSAF